MVKDLYSQLATRSVDDLLEISWRLSRRIIEITTRAGSGHPSSSLSAIDILTALYLGGILVYDPLHPGWRERDRFIMSKGHAAPGLYAVLAEAGYFNGGLLDSLRCLGSPLEGHPNMRRLPGVEASTGSLGQGLSIGLGHALAGRIDGLSYRVYVMIGDGESEEGQIWEAAMAAASYRVDHLIAILDYNRYQQSGSVAQVMPALVPVADKWRAFGWDVREVEGHDLNALLQAFNEMKAVTGQPQMLIAHTSKGKGLSVFEADPASHKHGVALNPQEAEAALVELDIRYAEKRGK